MRNCTLPELRGGRKGLQGCGFARFLVRFFGHFYFKLRYCGFYKTKRFAVFRNFQVTPMRLAVSLCYSVRCLFVILCGFEVFVPPLRTPRKYFVF